MSTNSFNSKRNLDVAGKSYEIFDISKIDGASNLPFSLKILLENLLRTEDGANITAEHIKALATWDPKVEPDTEIQFTPARVVMQDFTGVPCIVDLATMREALDDMAAAVRQIKSYWNEYGQREESIPMSWGNATPPAETFTPYPLAARSPVT